MPGSKKTKPPEANQPWDANKPWDATRRGIAEAISGLDGALPGTIVVRHMRCGTTGCARSSRATTGPPGTRSVNGKTVTKFLTDDQLARYQPWFDNTRRLKGLIAMLQTASVHAVEISEAGLHGPPPTDHSRPNPNHRATHR